MMTTAPASSRVAARLLAIRDGRDDRLLVLCGIAAAGCLPLAAGRWLRALRAEYDDELELLPFVRGTPDAADTACLLRRCARLQLPAVAIGDTAASAYSRWRACLPVAPLTWRVLETSTARAATPLPSGLLARWPARAAEPVDWPRSRRVVADLGAASPALGARIGAFTDALCDGSLVVAGIALDTAPGAPHTFVTDALDPLANYVRMQRIAAVTRRAPSLRSRL